MAGFRVREGAVTAVLSDDLEKWVRSAVGNALPGVLELMEAEAREVLAAAEAKWPVRTGVSRAGLEVVGTIDWRTREVSVAVRNDVPYAIYVALGKTSAWQKLVRGPMDVARLRVATELGPVILRAQKAA